MKCKELELYAIDYMEGALPLDKRQSVELHTASCQSCAGRLLGFQEVNQLLGTWEPIRPSASFDARLERRILGGEAASGWWKRLASVLWLQRPAVAGAMAMVLLVAVALARYYPSSPAYAPMSSPAHVAMQAPAEAASTVAPAGISVTQSADELALYQDLPVLENWDMLSNFEVLQDLRGTP